MTNSGPSRTLWSGPYTVRVVDEHRITEALRQAAAGRFPPQDGVVEVLPALEGLAAAVVGFSMHNFIATSLEPAEVLAQLPSADPGAPVNPGFLIWLAGRVGGHAHEPDVVLVATRQEAVDAELKLVRRDDLAKHPRVQLAGVLRSDVAVYTDPEGQGLITLAMSPLGLPNVSVEVEPGSRNTGLGRGLALAARSLTEPEEVLIAEVAPGNATSLRAFLAAGFKPVGSDVLMIETPEWSLGLDEKTAG